MKLNVAVASILSLLLGFMLALALEFMDRTVKTAEDVQQVAQAPLLGLIPAVDDIQATATPDLLRDRDLYVFANPTSRAAECCRSIRTNILFSGADRELKVLAVSSPNPREGKTTSVVYLGTTMAQSGQRILLVDTDMRRPRLHKSLGVSRTVGVSNLILGDASYEDAIKTTDIPNLYVLPCGPTPPNPAELLHTKRFRDILMEMQGRFDRILLDSPPIQAVTDGVVLGRLADGIILVAHGGRTNRDDLGRAARQLRDVDVNIVGVILNNLDIADRKYGSYYYYYYHHRYGYGETANVAEIEQSRA